METIAYNTLIRGELGCIAVEILMAGNEETQERELGFTERVGTESDKTGERVAAGGGRRALTAKAMYARLLRFRISTRRAGVLARVRRK